MKKSSLVGIEVYYEEKPIVKPPLAPTWKYGNDGVGYDDLDDDDGYVDDDDDVYGDIDRDIEEIKEVFKEVHSPVAGDIYKIKGLNLCAKYVGDVYTPLSKGKIRTMNYRRVNFYVDGENLLFASDEEKLQHLSGSDYDIT